MTAKAGDAYEATMSALVRRARFIPSPRRIAALPEFEAVVALGAPAVPLLLRDITDPARSWPALLVLTVATAPAWEEVLSPDIRGDIRRCREAWLAWGRARGHLPPAAHARGVAPG